MRNQVIAALKNHLSVLTEFTVLDPVYAPMLEGNMDDVFQRKFLNLFPIICLDYRSEARTRMNQGFNRVYPGRIIVAVLAVGDIETAQENLFKYVSDEDYILDRLYSTPTPAVDGTNLYLDIRPTVPGNYKESEDNRFYFSEIIPCNIELIK